MKDKISQSIQIDKDTAKELIKLTQCLLSDKVLLFRRYEERA